MGSLLNFYLTFPLAVQEREEERPVERCPTQAALLHKKSPQVKEGKPGGFIHNALWGKTRVVVL